MRCNHGGLVRGYDSDTERCRRVAEKEESLQREGREMPGFMWGKAAESIGKCDGDRNNNTFG
jgi:hypothetical protein